MDALDVRWRQRLSNLRRAFRLFEEAATAPQLSLLEEEGLIQRFEYTFELTWKTLKDFLAWGGIIEPMRTPREVLQQAFSAGTFTDHDGWQDMLGSRNETSHTYDEATARKITADIRQRFLPLLAAVFHQLDSSAQNPSA